MVVRAAWPVAHRGSHRHSHGWSVSVSDQELGKLVISGHRSHHRERRLRKVSSVQQSQWAIITTSTYQERRNMLLKRNHSQLISHLSWFSIRTKGLIIKHPNTRASILVTSLHLPLLKCLWNINSLRNPKSWPSGLQLLRHRCDINLMMEFNWKHNIIVHYHFHMTSYAT